MSRDSAARIVDANLNRCREGLRAAEEYARFALGDRGQANALRELRQAGSKPNSKPLIKVTRQVNRTT